MYVSPDKGGHVNQDGSRLSVNPSVQSGLVDTEVHLNAVPAFGYRFDGWSGDIASDSREIVIRLDVFTKLTANFSPLMPRWVITIIIAAAAIPLLFLWRRQRARRALSASQSQEHIL